MWSLVRLSPLLFCRGQTLCKGLMSGSVTVNLLYLVPILQRMCVVGLRESCCNQCEKDPLSSSPLSSSPDSSISNASGAESLAIQPQKLLILDARSYAAAVANRAKGGGCECPGEQHSSSAFQAISQRDLLPCDYPDTLQHCLYVAHLSERSASGQPPASPSKGRLSC